MDGLWDSRAITAVFEGSFAELPGHFEGIVGRLRRNFHRFSVHSFAISLRFRDHSGRIASSGAEE
jgi:hypothetical protein